MCGIAGVFGQRSPDVVESMLGLLAHRGPDDQHCVSGAAFSLGARRLAIVDLPGGRQPLSTPDGRVWACQNGEIYNFQELREELQRDGNVLATRSDTEVIPFLFREHGPALTDRLQGMFALAAWDCERQQGILARDRAGKKPLYYLEQAGSLWFASELKALLQVPGYTRELDPEATFHYLSLKNVPAPWTAFRGIRMLPPGHRLLWQAGGVQVQRYWRLDWTPWPGELDEQELASELVQRLRRAVRRRQLADVPVAFFLSGGIDSSLSTALACEAGSATVRTFTLRYRPDSTTAGKELDVACAREVAARYGTEHHEEELDFSRFQDELPAILTHFDEPFSGVMSTYFLSRLIARHVKVAISGDGADELFGSYLSHRLAGPLDAARRGQTPEKLEFAADADHLARLAGLPEWEWRSQLFVFTDAEKRELYRQPPDCSSSDWLRSICSGLSAHDPVNRMLEAEFAFQLPDQVLTFADRLSMAHSLEIRSGFLDTEVMEFAARIPGRFKIAGGEVKRILKTAARPYLPATVIDRPKEGFVLPVNQWLSGWMLPFAQQVLAPERLARHGLFRAQAVASYLEALAAGRPGAANKVLSLLCWQLWFDLYFWDRVPLPLTPLQHREAQQV